jgi:hypothetical protein
VHCVLLHSTLPMSTMSVHDGILHVHFVQAIRVRAYGLHVCTDTLAGSADALGGLLDAHAWLRDRL